MTIETINWRIHVWKRENNFTNNRGATQMTRITNAMRDTIVETAVAKSGALEAVEAEKANKAAQMDALEGAE